MALDDPAIGYPVLVQSIGEFGRLNPRRDEILQPVRLRLLQGALNLVLGDRDLLDLVFVEQGLEPAVRDRRQLGALQIKALNEQHQQHRRDHVPEMDLLLLLHAGPPRASSPRPKPRKRSHPVYHSEATPRRCKAPTAATNS